MNPRDNNFYPRTLAENLKVFGRVIFEGLEEGFEKGFLKPLKKKGKRNPTLPLI
jgi:hypothetical protein